MDPHSADTVVFCVRFQDELQRWSQAMEQAVQTLAAEEAPGSSGAKTHSLPAPSSSSAAPPEPSSAKKDKEKKFNRFAKKKWKEMRGPSGGNVA